jgi:hypothetical protein
MKFQRKLTKNNGYGSISITKPILDELTNNSAEHVEISYNEQSGVIIVKHL